MMHRSIAALILTVVASLTVAANSVLEWSPAASPSATPLQAKPDGWTLPADAEQKKSPLTVDDKILAQGKSVFKSKCQKCHGANGLGDGPDADPEHKEDMDLTVASRASKNPDGVVFYKVSGGRKKPKMPSFKAELSEEQIWTVVAYAQSLRKK